MKRKYIVMFMCLFIVLSMQGCQESPKEDIVVNKNEGTMEQAMKKEKTDENEDIPETYEDSFISKTDAINISVDADIESIHDKIPVIRVKPHEITGDEAKHWAEVLFEGKTAYEPCKLTKTQIEEKILSLKHKISDDSYLIEEGYSEDEIEELKALYSEMIASYEEVYEDASDTQKKRECDWKFHPYNYYEEIPLDEDDELNKTWVLQAMTDDLNGHTALIDAANRDEEDYKIHMLWFYYTDIQDADMKDSEEIFNQELTEEEAIKLGNDTLDKLNLSDDWGLWNVASYSNTGTDQIYQLYYTPIYNGVQTMLGPEDIDVKSEDLYAANLYYSEVIVTIENGLITGIELTSPMDVVCFENENVDTLSFEEAYEAFQSQMQAKVSRNTYIDPNDPEAENYQVELKVTEIRQALFRVKEKNNEDEYLMIPVWVFSGNVVVDGEDWGENDFVTVNGLDGSIIDMNLGY